jgi:hypothetical protein
MVLGCLLTGEQMRVLAEGLGVNRGLKTLGIAFATFGDTGAQFLAKALETNTTLEVLGIPSKLAIINPR